MKSTARTSLYGPSGPPLLPIASLFTIMMALLLCVVNAKNNNRHAHLLAGHRRGFHHPLFASTKNKHHPLLFNNKNDIIPSPLFGVRGGGDDDDFVEENPEYEPPKDGKIDNSDDGTDDDVVADDDGSDSEVSEIEGDESSDEERIDDDDDDEEEEKEKDLVSISNSKQSKSKHTSSSSSTMSKSKSSKQSSINKRLFNLWKSNQFNIYILLAVIAFRNDIYQLCIQYNIIPTQIINPITGERKIVVRWTTDVLKLILVAEIVRRCFLPSRRPVVDDESDGTAAIEKRNQTTTDDVDDEDIMPTTKQQPSPAVPLLLLLLIILILPTLLRRNIITSGYTPLLLPIVTSFIFRSMRGGGVVDSNLMQWILPALGDGDLVTRMAYMPPLEQHYAFEQLNERYYRDWGAWRKAFPTNPALQSHHHHYYYLGRKNQTSEIGVGGSGSGGGGSSASSGMMALIDAITSRKSSSLSSVQQKQYSSGSKSKVSSLSNKYPNVYNNGTAIILDMTKLDTQASSMETIRDQISFLVHLVQSEDDEFFRSKKQSAGGEVVQQANDNVSPPPPPPPPELEVIVLLESPGGSVSSYGLAASHLQRLRSTRGIKLTICVDTVAASGGYMMACMASPGHLLCAPFAMVGSIGVIGQSVNVQKALEKFGVRPYVFLGGRNKQPVGMLGDVTKDGMETMQHMIDRIHESFREHVREAREDSLVKAFVAEGGAADKPPSNYFQLGNSQTKLSHSQQSLDRVANGDVFLGVQALKLGLVDRLITSDEYIAERIQHGTRVLKLVIHRRPVGLSSLLIGPPHHSFAWNKWIVRAKNVASMIASSWSDIDASHVNSVQLKMENTRL